MPRMRRDSGVRTELWQRRRPTTLLLLLIWARETTCSTRAFRATSMQRGCRRRRGRRGTWLRAGLDNDEFTRLARRMAHLERVVSEQNTEMEVMRSSMDEMRMIIQIQARIDSLLVDGGGEEGLLSARLEFGGNGEPDPHLVKQMLKLLRMRQRILQAWEYEDMEAEEEELTGESLASEFNAVRGLRGLSPSNIASGAPDSRRDPRCDNAADITYSMYDPPDSGDVEKAAAAAAAGAGGESGEEDGVAHGYGFGYGSRLALRPPRTNQDAADAAGASVVAALMEGRRRLIVEVDDAQLRFNAPDFCNKAMAEFVELLVLPLTTALENLNAEQDRCKIVIQGAHRVAEAKQAMVLDAPDSLQVVALEDAKVSKKDRVVAIVAPENWTGKKGKHLKRVLAEAHDAAIILINPTDADKFLPPADFNTFEFVYHLRPLRVNYLQPLPPPAHARPRYRAEEERHKHPSPPTGEALLLESLGEAVRAEEEALAAGAGASEAAAAANAAAAAGISAAVDNTATVSAERIGDLSIDRGAQHGERAFATRSAMDVSSTATSEDAWQGRDTGFRERPSSSSGGERSSYEPAAAAMTPAGEAMGPGRGWKGEDRDCSAEDDTVGIRRERWGQGEVGDWDGCDEAEEMSALAVTLRQYPDAWEAFVDLHDGIGFRLCGTWDLEPPRSAVETVVMDHILRIVMD